MQAIEGFGGKEKFTPILLFGIDSGVTDGFRKRRKSQRNIRRGRHNSMLVGILVRDVLAQLSNKVIRRPNNVETLQNVCIPDWGCARTDVSHIRSHQICQAAWIPVSSKTGGLKNEPIIVVLQRRRYLSLCQDMNNPLRSIQELSGDGRIVGF